MSANPQVRHWCFTFHNYTDDDLSRIATLGASSRITYLVYGKEIAPTTGSPHLQGFVSFSRTTRRSVVQALIAGNKLINCEQLRSTPFQAANYCKKDGDFTEFGVPPEANDGQGKRTDWDKYREWIDGLGRIPTRREIINHNPSLYARYSRKCTEIAEAFLPSIRLIGDGETPRFGWQTRVSGLVSSPASPRKIHFVVDEEGNKGKSWICAWALSTHPDTVQVLRIGKRDDLAYSIDETKSVFLFDVPRTQMTYLQYSVLESLKDQMIFSPKYESSLKLLRTRPVVIVFCNEAPDMEAMTHDRYEIINI